MKCKYLSDKAYLLHLNLRLQFGFESLRPRINSSHWKVQSASQTCMYYHIEELVTYLSSYSKARHRLYNHSDSPVSKPMIAIILIREQENFLSHSYDVEKKE